MKTIHILLGCIFIAITALILAGCGATSGTGGTGYGADAGPWSQSPNRATPTGQPEQVPNVALAVLLRGKSAENEQIKLDIAQLELKYLDQWVPVTNRDAIARIETLPLIISQKGITAMLATQKTMVPRRKYTHLRLRFDDKKTLLVRGEKELPLTLQATLELGEWTPEEKAINTLTVTLDGTKVTATTGSATLPTNALTIAKGTASAGFNGKIVPASPTARVDAFWGNTKLVIGTAIPAAADGAFQIPNLPAGNYRLEVTNPGYHQADEDKKPITLDGKVLDLGNLKLLKD